MYTVLLQQSPHLRVVRFDELAEGLRAHEELVLVPQVVAGPEPVWPQLPYGSLDVPAIHIAQSFM